MNSFQILLNKETGWSDWQKPHADYKLACCDCGLTHGIQFRVKDIWGNVLDPTINQVEFRVSRDERSTAAHRREETKRKKRK